MNKHYYIHSESYYAASVPLVGSPNIPIVDDVMFGDDLAEAKMQWTELDGLTAQIQVFHDAWQLIDRYPELFAGLSALGNPTVKEFTAFLDAQGFTDETTRTRDHSTRA